MNLFTPLSPVASDQLAELNTLIQGLEIDETLEDKWSYSIWGTAEYSSQKAYKQLKCTLCQPYFQLDVEILWLWSA